MMMMHWTGGMSPQEVVTIKFVRDIPEVKATRGQILTIPRGCNVAEFVYYRGDYLLEQEDFVWASPLEALGSQAL